MQKQIKFKKNLIFKRVLFLTMLVIAFYVIFNFSAQDGQISGSLSRKVTEFIVNLVSKIKTMDINRKLHWIAKLEPAIRKFAHFAIYAVVGFSTMGLMCTFDMRNIFKVIISFIIGGTYAITDEIHQYFTPGRNASIVDMCIDSAGVLIGIFILITLIVFVEAIVNWLKR